MVLQRLKTPDQYSKEAKRQVLDDKCLENNDVYLFTFSESFLSLDEDTKGYFS